jgi:hypothetical protein
MKYIIDKVKSYKNIVLNSVKVSINKGLLKVAAWNSVNLPIKGKQQTQNKGPKHNPTTPGNLKTQKPRFKRS